jgi:hypothetical protein
MPGDIRREYELHIHKLEEESRKKREEERRASEDLICKIMVRMILSRIPKGLNFENIKCRMFEICCFNNVPLLM